MPTKITIRHGLFGLRRFTITIENEDIMSSLDDLAAAVAANNDRGDALITLVQGLADKLDLLEIDDDRLKSLTAEIREQAAELGAAVEANTSEDGDDDGPGEDIEPTVPEAEGEAVEPTEGDAPTEG